MTHELIDDSSSLVLICDKAKDQSSLAVDAKFTKLLLSLGEAETEKEKVADPDMPMPADHEICGSTKVDPEENQKEEPIDEPPKPAKQSVNPSPEHKPEEE